MVVEMTSRGRSSICWGIPLPVRNWAVSWEKLLQLWFNKSYLQQDVPSWIGNSKRHHFTTCPLWTDPCLEPAGTPWTSLHLSLYCPPWKVSFIMWLNQHRAGTLFSHYLFYFERLAKLCPSWITALYTASSKEIFLEKIGMSWGVRWHKTGCHEDYDDARRTFPWTTTAVCHIPSIGRPISCWPRFRAIPWLRS